MTSSRTYVAESAVHAEVEGVETGEAVEADLVHDPAQDMLARAMSFAEDLAGLAVRRLEAAGLPGTLGFVAEKRAQIVMIRAIARHYAQIVKKMRTSGNNRRRIEAAIEQAAKGIPLVLR